MQGGLGIYWAPYGILLAIFLALSSSVSLTFDGITSLFLLNYNSNSLGWTSDRYESTYLSSGLVEDEILDTILQLCYCQV